MFYKNHTLNLKTKQCIFVMSGYIYLIKINNENINDLYKIGRTLNFKSRFSQYPKCTEQILVKFIDNFVNIESILIQLFKSTFKLYKGNEYFIGDVNKMISFVNYTCDKYFINDMIYIKFISNKNQNSKNYTYDFLLKQKIFENSNFSKINNYKLNFIGEEETNKYIENKNLFLKCCQFEKTSFINYYYYIDNIHLNENLIENINKHIDSNTEMYLFDKSYPYFKKITTKEKIYEIIFDKIILKYCCFILKGYDLHKQHLTKSERDNFNKFINFLTLNSESLIDIFLVHLQSYNENTIIFKKLFNDTKNNKQKRKKFLINNIENLENESILVKEIN